jgi:hypothetical protein
VRAWWTELVHVTAAGFAPPGATVTASGNATMGVTVAVSGVFPPAADVAPSAAPERPRPLEISNPCTALRSVMLVSGTASAYNGGDMTSVTTTTGQAEVFCADTSGAIRGQWTSAASGTPVTKQLTASDTATPGGGIVVTGRAARCRRA